MADLILPLIISFIIIYGLYKKLDVFTVFLEGAKKGLDISIKILPSLIGLITAVYMIRASSAVDIITNIVAPFLDIIGIPKETAPLMMLKPISGGGGLAMGTDIIKIYGADSYIGRVCAIMLASSETSLYTMSIYYGSLGINKIRYTLFAVLTADFVAFFVASIVARIMF